MLIFDCFNMGEDWLNHELFLADQIVFCCPCGDARYSSDLISISREAVRSK